MRIKKLFIAISLANSIISNAHAEDISILPTEDVYESHSFELADEGSDISISEGATWVDISFNKLNSLAGLSLPSSVQSLYTYNNRITTLSGFSPNSGIKTISLDNNRIDTLSGFVPPTTVTELSFRSNDIDESGLAGLTLNEGLEYLWLYDNLITNADTLTLPSTLKLLDLGFNKLSSLPANLPSGLTMLLLDNNPLDLSQQATLPEGLLELNLSSCKLSDLSGLQLPSTLQYLYLYNNNLSKEDIAALELPDSLLYMDLGGNSEITDLDGITIPPNASVYHDGLYIPIVYAEGKPINASFAADAKAGKKHKKGKKKKGKKSAADIEALSPSGIGKRSG